MVKKLMFMIPTAGKSKEQIIEETLKAFEKFKEAHPELDEKAPAEEESEIVLIPTRKPSTIDQQR